MRLFLFFVALFLIACNNSATIQEENISQLFTQLSADSTGINFVNQLDYNKDFNIYTYRNFIMEAE